jgi:plasmid stabilization system protein ParE
MPQIILVPKAQDNLKKLHDFIAKERPESAKEAVKAIIGNIEKLILFPEIGVPDANVTGLRTLIIPFGKSGYSVFYKWKEGDELLEVLKIKHDRQSNN